MKKLILFMSVAVALFADVSTRVTAVDKTSVSVEPKEGIVKGQSAFVIREFANGHSVMIATCVVEEGLTTLACRPFDYLEHDSLSLVRSDIREGDLVRIGLLSNSMSIIAPDQKRYLQVKEMRPNVFWVHPDIFAVALKEEGNPVPTKQDLQKFCKDNVIGTLVFALEEMIYDVDCVSFEVIASMPSPQN